MFILRTFQAHMITEATRLAGNNEKLLVAHVDPGSGKTSGYLLASDALNQMGVGTRLVVFTPRLNLAIQAETDWQELRGLLPGLTMGRIAQRDNELPFLRRNEAGELAFGYATTYQSLLANPKDHLDFLREAPTIVVFDEAQQLGAPAELGGEGTRSGKVCEEVAALAAFVFLLTGTPRRPDGRPLILASYGEPNAKGHRPLLHHVRASYQTGVAEGYLREFEAVLHDGQGLWQYLGEEPQTLTLSELTRRVSHVIRQQGYWEPLVDRFVAKLRDVRAESHPEFVGLVAAIDQAQAREIIAYLKRSAPDLRVVLAVSDERLSKDNLRRFRKKAEGDILVTVAMAHVGFDCQRIAVILPLTNARQEGWLRQLIGRALRVWDGKDRKGDVPVPPAELQICYVVAPDDKLMAEFLDMMRGESLAGIFERPDRPGPDGPATQPKLGVGLGAEMLDDRLLSLNPRGDADHAELVALRALVARFELPRGVYEARLMALLREAKGSAAVPPRQDGRKQVDPRPESRARPMQPEQRTEKEREKELRELCQRLAKRCDNFMKEHVSGWQYGFTHAEAKRQFGTPLTRCGLGDLPERVTWYSTFFDARRAEYAGLT